MVRVQIQLEGGTASPLPPTIVEALAEAGIGLETADGLLTLAFPRLADASTTDRA